MVIHKTNQTISQLISKLAGNLTQLVKYNSSQYHSVSNYIRNLRRIRTIGISSTFLFSLLLLTIIIPLYNVTGVEDIMATTTPCTNTGDSSVGTNCSLTFTSTRLTASADLTVSSTDGTFASSSSSNNAAFTLSTNNYTGYILTLTGSSSATTLKDNVSNNTLDSISSNITLTDFSANNATGKANNNKWGIIPSSYKSNNSITSNNTTTFFPSPSSTNTITMDETTSANSGSGQAKSYTIGLGVRADYTKTAGTYNNTNSGNTLTLAYVANPVSYSITYSGGSGGNNVTNLPTFTNGSHTQTGPASATSVLISSTIPERTGYDFKGWCTVQVADGASCTGTTYNPNGSGTNLSYGIDRTTNSNTATLYAMWSIQSYTQTVNYYCQTAAGLAGTQYTYTESVNYGSNFTFNSTKATSCYNGTSHSSTMYTANNGTTSQTIDYTVTGAVSSTAYFNRNTRTITLAKGTGISAVSATGGGIKSTSGTTYTIYYGGTVSIDATVNTASNYEWVNWTDTSGGSSFSTTKNYTFNSVTDNYSLTANGEMAKIYMWNATSSDCGTTMWDNRDGTERSYTTAKIGSLCWMTKSLMLGKSTTTALTPSTSNVSSSGYTLPASSTSGFSSYTAQNIYVPATTACSSSRACYGYYTYAAATAGSNPSSGVSSYDICPKGWRLPTQAEFNTLKSSYSTGATLTASPWYGVYSGYYFSGFFYNGGSYGYYWSSTANGSNLAYLLNFSSSSASVGGGSGYKYSGFAVRCVMKNYMQDQTTDTLAALMPSNGSTTTLYDKRDGNSYTIVKIGNLYWMKENLKIMGTVTAALSNFSGSDFNIEGGGSLTSGNTYTAARATLSTNSSYPGAYYNYCAASAGTVCTASNSTNASSDICPSGWRLPTNAEFGTIGTSSGSTTNVSAFGAIYSGYYYNGTLSDTGSYGAWWSSTAYGTTYRYSLDYGSGKLYSGSYYSRQYGNSIRCVKSS